MKFMLTFHIKPEAKGRDEVIARFKQTGGHAYSLMWSDLMELRLVSVIEDPQLVEVLRAA